MSFRRYDSYSGLVYDETVVHVPRRRVDPTWPHSTAVVRPRYHTPAQGAERLLEKALRVVAERAPLLELEVIEALPASLAVRIWEAIRVSGRESLVVWQRFLQSGHASGCSEFGHYVCFNKPSTPLVDIYSTLSSPKCNWLVDLTLCDFPVASNAEWKCLTALQNLQNLHIESTKAGDRQGVFGDDIIEYWADRALQHGSFSRLETLWLNNHRRITKAIFPFLSSFPLLDTLCALEVPITPRQTGKLPPDWKLHSSTPVTLVSGQQDQVTPDPRAHEFTTMKEKYLSERLAEDKMATPNLTVKLGEILRPTFRSSLALLFKRTGPTGEAVLRSDKRALPAGASDARPSALKQRKVRESKGMGLDSLLLRF